jgi:hypothetical protein
VSSPLRFALASTLVTLPFSCRDPAPSGPVEGQASDPGAAQTVCGEQKPGALPEPLSALPGRAAGFCVDPYLRVRVVDASDGAEFDEICQRAFGELCSGITSWGLRRIGVMRYLEEGGSRGAVDVLAARFTGPESALAAFTERALIEVDPYEPSARAIDGLEFAVLLDATATLVRGVDLFELRYSGRGESRSRRLETAHRVLSELSRRLAEPSVRGENTPRPDDAPRAVRALPTEDRLAWGVRMTSRDLFGVDGAGPGALGFYQRGALRFQVMVVSARDEAAVSDLMRALSHSPGHHDLEDVPFDAFELSAPLAVGDLPLSWLVGRQGGRLAAVGSERELPLSRRDNAPRHWLNRAEKMRLLRKTLLLR